MGICEVGWLKSGVRRGQSVSIMGTHMYCALSDYAERFGDPGTGAFFIDGNAGIVQLF
jgi:hypothetical protein